MQNDKINFSLIIPIGLMLFSFFFGAGNLIFPPVLGQHWLGHARLLPERRWLPAFGRTRYGYEAKR